MLNSFQQLFIRYTNFFSFDITLNSTLTTLAYNISLKWEYSSQIHTKWNSSSTPVLQMGQILSSGCLFLNLPVSMCSGSIIESYFYKGSLNDLNRIWSFAL